MIEHANSHSVSYEEIFTYLGTSEAALSRTQVIEKMNVFGRNCLPISPPKPAWKRFFAQFHNLLIYVLIASGLLSALLQHYVDSGVILAVREGRTVYDNIVKSIMFILPTNLAEALVIFIAIMFGCMLPITPTQILWINMITAIALAAVIILQLIFSYLPISQTIFDLESIILNDWLIIILASLPVVLVVELEKAIQRRFKVSRLKSNPIPAH